MNKIKDYIIKKLGGFTWWEYTRERARLGAIVENHIDDKVWLLKQMGIQRTNEVMGISCDLKRELVIERKVT